MHNRPILLCSGRCARSNKLGFGLLFLAAAVLSFVAGQSYEARTITRADEEAVSSIPLPLPEQTPTPQPVGTNL